MAHQLLRRVPESVPLALQRPDGQLEVVPQAPELSALFEGLPNDRALGKPESGLLVCRVELNSKFASDFGSAPDPGAVLRLAGRVFFFSGSGSRYSDFFSLPKFALPVGKDVEVELIDFDLMHHDYLGQFGSPFDGFLPIAIKHPKFEHRLDCRLLDSNGISTRIKPMLKHAAVALKGMLRTRPNPRLTDFGYAKTRHQQAWDELDQIAALAGWDEPQLAPLVETVRAADEAWFKAAEELLTAQLSKLTQGPDAKVRTPFVEASEPSVSCDRGATTTCRLKVTVQQRQNSTRVAAKLVDAQGMELHPLIEVEKVNDPHVPKGFVRARWTITLPEGRPIGSYSGAPGVNPGSRIRVLELCSERPRCWLRVD